MTVDEFIEKWRASGGNERANTHFFISDLTALIGVDPPRPTRADTAANDYVFERNVIKTEIDGTTSNGWIDCYKRDCFILEAKQGSDADRAAVDAGQGESLKDFFGQTAAERFKRGMAKRGTGQWAAAMQKAAGQAEGYAKALPKEHGWPPFLLVSDIGYCIDVYADFSRSGKGYAPFPDRHRYRIELEGLRDEKVRERLKAIWEEPMSLDPSAEAARVTREIADHLATVARRLEGREQNPDGVAHFLMRLLFTMFAEDTGLIPKKSFSALLTDNRDEPDILGRQVSSLWADMDKGGHSAAIAKKVLKINGWLFKDRTFIDLKSEEIEVLIKAAEATWEHVEPAIFGTLLERALNPKERAKLGAHYTPRAYVERLVEPTIMEPLREDWLGARTAAAEAAEVGDKDKARKLVEAFHGRLARTKVLDPACGTGNFLYVAMARMKELEGEVLELLEELGDRQYLAEISGHTITPENFLGIEINPRAAAIAQLVLWIGYLQWHFKVNGEDRMPEPPVLRDVKTIECRDALIEYDRKELERDENGVPLSIWDGTTYKLNHTGKKLIPDTTARKELYRYFGVRPAKWPRADFIIGNPPFIGNKRMRKRLGAGYTEAVRGSRSALSDEIDFVMYWWDQAAAAVANGTARRAGLITTKTIGQASNRPVVGRWLSNAKNPVSLRFAIANHPWFDTETVAAVRIAMTVSGHGDSVGRLVTLRDERKVKGVAVYETDEVFGKIQPDLSVGVPVASAVSLKAAKKMSWMGVKMSGEGFKVDAQRRQQFAAQDYPEERLPLVIAGSDLTERQTPIWAIDTFGQGEEELRREYPGVYQHLLETVKPERDENDRDTYKEKWWLFAEPRPHLRLSIAGIQRCIATSETAKFRTFMFAPTRGVLFDGSVIVIASDDAYVLGVVSSHIHVVWANRAGGRMGAGNDPRYQNEVCFDTFPFPECSQELMARIRQPAEDLDSLRKQVLERHPDLTLTKLYNTLEALRGAEVSGGVLGEKEREIAERGCVSLIRQYHDAIDVAVAEAYGWGDLLKEASPSTSSGRTVWVDGVDEIILERLVALNKERATEETKGKVRWLRPEFQAPGYVVPEEQAELGLPEEAKPEAEIIEWPARLPDQVIAVSQVVERAGRPIAANDVARAFKGKRAGTVAPVLDALAGMGRLRKLEDGRFAA